METTAKLLKNGRSQAVRLPKALRFEGDRVKISKNGQKVILEPIEKATWPNDFWSKFSPDSDFLIPTPRKSKEVDLD